MKGNKKKQESDSAVIHETYGYLNDKENKVFAKVSWYEGEPKFDIRKCAKDSDGNLKLYSGISLTESELNSLVSLAESTKRKGVDFGEIFKSAESIQENRKKGFRTENGFIKLHRKK